MAGLDKMKEFILDDARNEASQLLSNANREADEILKNAQLQAKRMENEAEASMFDEVRDFKEKNKGKAEFEKRTRLLMAKQELIEKMLEKTYEQISTYPEDEYFQLLLKMLNCYLRKGEGVLYFNKRDLQRMPESFLKSVKNIAEEKGGSVIVSQEERLIDNGFILVYGGLEENCSFLAIMNSRKYKLQDLAAKLLFT